MATVAIRSQVNGAADRLDHVHGTELAEDGLEYWPTDLTCFSA